MLSATNLWKSYQLPEGRPQDILKGVEISLFKGETAAVTGPSGSGKSTLLALLAGLDQPDKGRILIDETDITTMNENDLTDFRGKRIGMVFQQFHLMPHLTVEENVRLPLEILGLTQELDEVPPLLHRVGLDHRKEHLPRQLSGGECQRTAIARALAVSPDILLADEPTGNLDAKTGAAVSDLLFELVREIHMTMIIVTHNNRLAERCGRTLHLQDGKLV